MPNCGVFSTQNDVFRTENDGNSVLKCRFLHPPGGKNDHGASCSPCNGSVAEPVCPCPVPSPGNTHVINPINLPLFWGHI